MTKLKLYNGDCGDILPQIEDESVDCIVTDPPYGVNFKQDFYDDGTESVDVQMPRWFNEWHRVLKDDCYAFVFTGIRNIEKWISCGIESGFTFKNIIATRAFNNGSMVRNRNNFMFTLQPILLFSKGNGKPFNDVDMFPTSSEWMKDSRNRKPKPFTYQYPNFIEPCIAYGTEVFGGEKNNKEWHPNAKNTKLISFFIQISSVCGGCILDPFMGSGTTGVSALANERSFIGIEKDAHWFEVASKRLKNTAPLFTGEG